MIKLRNPFITVCGDIDCLELSAQKPNLSQRAGFHHIEFQLNNIDVKDALGCFEKEGFNFTKKERAHHTTYDVDYRGCVFRITDDSLLHKVRDEIGR